MPGKDGLELCRRLRAASGPSAAIPVIFMTALGEPADRIVGLELGGDDYQPKPFEVRELIARIRAVLRRTSGAARQTSAQRRDFRQLWAARRPFSDLEAGSSICLAVT